MFVVGMRTYIYMHINNVCVYVHKIYVLPISVCFPFSLLHSVRLHFISFRHSQIVSVLVYVFEEEEEENEDNDSLRKKQMGAICARNKWNMQMTTTDKLCKDIRYDILHMYILM